jgi:hypothetical protein
MNKMNLNLNETRTDPFRTVSGGGIDSTEGSATTFTAASNACSATVTVHVRDVKLTKNFSVLEPTPHGTSFLINSNNPGAGILGAGMEVEFYIAPQNVSFYRVWTWEAPFPKCLATNITGYFTKWLSSDLAVDTSGAPGYQINPDNRLYDNARSFFNSYPWPLYEGSFQYNITNMWTIPGSMQTNVLGVFPDEAKLLDANGDFSVTKYGQTIIRNLYSNESYSPTSSQ